MAIAWPLARCPDCVGSRNVSAGDIHLQVPQKRPEPRIKGQSGSASSREGSGLGNTEGSMRDLDARQRHL